VWVGNGSVWVVVEERFAFLAVVTHRVVLAVVTHAAADASSRLVDRRVEVTPGRMTITLAACKVK